MFSKIMRYVLLLQIISFICMSNLFSQIFAFPIGDKELINNSTHIVVGKVKNLECFWFQGSKRKMICTKVFIEPENVLKGELNNKKEMVIYTPVGELDGIRMRIVGAPEYEIGEKVLVFCELQKEGYFENYAAYLGKKTIKNELIIENNISLKSYVSKIKSFMKGEIK